MHLRFIQSRATNWLFSLFGIAVRISVAKSEEILCARSTIFHCINMESWDAASDKLIYPHRRENSDVTFDTRQITIFFLRMSKGLQHAHISNRLLNVTFSTFLRAFFSEHINWNKNIDVVFFYSSDWSDGDVFIRACGVGGVSICIYIDLSECHTISPLPQICGLFTFKFYGIIAIFWYSFIFRFFFCSFCMLIRVKLNHL